MRHQRTHDPKHIASRKKRGKKPRNRFDPLADILEGASKHDTLKSLDYHGTVIALGAMGVNPVIVDTMHQLMVTPKVVKYVTDNNCSANGGPTLGELAKLARECAQAEKYKDDTSTSKEEQQRKDVDKLLSAVDPELRTVIQNAIRVHQNNRPATGVPMYMPFPPMGTGMIVPPGTTPQPGMHPFASYPYFGAPGAPGVMAPQMHPNSSALQAAAAMNAVASAAAIVSNGTGVATGDSSSRPTMVPMTAPVGPPPPGFMYPVPVPGGGYIVYRPSPATRGSSESSATSAESSMKSSTTPVKRKKKAPTTSKAAAAASSSDPTGKKKAKMDSEQKEDADSGEDTE